MKLVGRNIEIELLLQNLNSDASKFVAMYGRRRIGKTFLIRETYANHLVFDCSGLYEGTLESNLENFWTLLSKKHRRAIPFPNSWIQAFSLLEDYLNNIKHKQKKVIFLDEIAWFDTPKSGFIGALSNFWNSYCTRRKDIVLVICGSSASWIINKVVKSKGGLHNRIDQIIELFPFSLAESVEFLKKKKIVFNLKDLTTLYLCMGGVPYYLNQVPPGKSIPQIIEYLFLQQNSVLRNEFDNLYAALFKNHEAYVNVIKTLNSKNKGLNRSEISRITKLPSGGTLTKILEDLEQCGFIIKQYDFAKSKADGLFRLVDFYSIFYLKFLYRKKEKITAHKLMDSVGFKSWSGFAFENLCFAHLRTLTEYLGISGINYNTYSFIDKGSDVSTGAQIDLVIDRSDNCVNIVECKFTTEAYVMTKKDCENWQNKIYSFRSKTKTRKAIFPTLITPFEAERNQHYLSIVANEINLENLINTKIPISNL